MPTALAYRLILFRAGIQVHRTVFASKGEDLSIRRETTGNERERGVARLEGNGEICIVEYAKTTRFGIWRHA
jgi:hypothetical protein